MGPSITLHGAPPTEVHNLCNGRYTWKMAVTWTAASLTFTLTLTGARLDVHVEDGRDVDGRLAHIHTHTHRCSPG